MRAERFHIGVVTALAGLVLLTHVLGATALPSALWGAHLYAFLPAPALPLALLATLIALVLAWRAPTRVPWPAAPPVRWRALATVALGAIGFAVFWWLRIRHTLLGDSGPLSHDLPLGERSHHLQPLSLVLHHYAYVWTQSWFAGPGRTPEQQAYDAVALDSVVAGAIFVPVAIGLARRLVMDGRVTTAGDPPAQTRGLVALAALLLLTQGFMQLFFGYVENYTWFALMMALFLWGGLGFLARRAPLILAVLPLEIAIGLNLSGVVLLPSIAVLGVWGLTQADLRRAVVRDLALTVVSLVGLHFLLQTLGHFDTVVAIRYMWDLVAKGQAMEKHSVATLFEPAHLRDVFAIHMLIGPFAGLLLVPVAIARVIGAGRGLFRDARLLFVLAAAGPPLVASWTYGDSIQGLPRDWDLFAPFALLYVAAAIYCLASERMRTATLGRLLAIGAVVSLFHTGAWVALNTSERRSLERYKTLPATRGRTQMVVAYWYLNHGDRARAREWFTRSVEAYPANNASQYELGLYAMDDGHYEEAAQRFWIATEARPDKATYRFALVDALVLAGHPDSALPQLERLVKEHPQQPEYWACAGIVLAGLGRHDQARVALARAATLAPHDAVLAELVRDLDSGDFYRREVARDWDALVLR
jgi:tetratricopeptide (TPR) repeat protein